MYSARRGASRRHESGRCNLASSSMMVGWALTKSMSCSSARYSHWRSRLGIGCMLDAPTVSRPIGVRRA
eukprot:2616452-Prymnesium_polylepis.2